jgi:hypothetical protein
MISKPVRYWPDEDYTGTVLSSLWCPYCKEAQVVEYTFDLQKEDAFILGHKKPSSVLVPRKPPEGLTVSPRKKGPKKR